MKQITLIVNNEPIQLLLDDLSHFTFVNDRYTWMVYVNGNRKLLKISITQIVEQLSNPHFISVDRNNIIHSGSITKIQSKPHVKFWLKNGYEFVMNN